MTDLVSIFCEIDDFCKEYVKQVGKNLLSDGAGKRKKVISLQASEVITISIWYHFSGYATFKDYYVKHAQVHLKQEFPKLVSYSRFIELRKKIVELTLAFLTLKKLSNSSEISFIDSFKLEVCNIKRASSHKVIKFAQKGKTSVGWFYGMKLHCIINHQGELVNFYITPGNVADNNEKVLFALTKKILGKLFGDKGYLVNETVFTRLYKNGVHLITKIRKNMKNKLMLLFDKLMLKKRGLIESVGNILKNRHNLEHSRHRSPFGFFLNIFSTLIAYQFRPKKPHLTCVNNLLVALA